MASGSEQYGGKSPKGSKLKAKTPAQTRAPRYSGKRGDTNQDWPF